MKIMNRILSGVLCATIMCNIITVTMPVTTVEAATGKVKSIKVVNLPAKTLTLKKGKSKVLKIKVNTTKSNVSKAYTFKSSKKKVVKVVRNGDNIEVKALKEGEAKVTIKSKANPNKKTIIDVTVGKPVKKITLNKKKLTLFTGDEYKLTSTVKKKNATNKNVIYKSSDKSVVKVSKKKGKVTAIAPGTAYVTAYAADGSGVKAKCKIEVKKGNEIESINLIATNCVKVVLKKKQELKRKDFTVKIKTEKKEEYEEVEIYKGLYSEDKRTYFVYFDSYISPGQYIHVSVAGLSIDENKMSKEMVYCNESDNKVVYEEEVYEKLVGEEFSYTYNFNAADDIESIEVENLAEGLTYEQNGNDVDVTGNFTKTGIYKSEITATDKSGIVWVYKSTFVIGSKDELVVYTPDIEQYAEGTYVDEHGKEVQYAEVQSYVYYSGGNRSNVYIRLDEEDEMIASIGNAVDYDDEDDYDGDDDGYFDDGLTVGKHKVVVSATDGKIEAEYIAYFTIKEAMVVEGKIKTKTGKPIFDAEIDFMSKDNLNSYDTRTNEKGKYKILIPAGVYDIAFDVGNRGAMSVPTEYVCDKKITSNSKIKYTFDVYELKYKFDNDKVKMSRLDQWYDKKGNYFANVYSDKLLYVPKGNLYMTTSYKVNGKKYVITIKANVTGDMEVIAKVKK